MRSKTKTTQNTSETGGAARTVIPGSMETGKSLSDTPAGGQNGRLDNPVWGANQLARPKLVTGPGIVPPQWRCIVREILITEKQLQTRVRELGRAITRDYVGKDLVVVAILTGSVMFLADLLRCLMVPLRLDFIGVSSYRKGTRGGSLVYTKDLQVDIKNRDVLLVDDILDTGRTLTAILQKVIQLNPRSVRICVLMDKPARRVQHIQVDYVGFVIPNVFVVGYGLDYAESYRNLPFVGTLRPELL